MALLVTIIPCLNCGGVDFEKLSGQYICQNCDTQSQEIEERSFDDFTEGTAYVPRGNDEKEEIISQKLDSERQLTSWECYNLILKGLVDELIQLGAQPRLRKTAFQLWALFLHKEQVAFFSKTEDELPALSTTFKNKDIEVLYGIKSFRRVFFKDLQKVGFQNIGKNYPKETKPKKRKADTECSGSESNADDSGDSRGSTRRLRHKQRKLDMSRVNESLSLSSKNDLAASLERLGVSQQRKGQKEVSISFRSSAHEQMTKLSKQFEETMKKFGHDLDRIPPNIRRIYSNRLYSRTNRCYSKQKCPPKPLNIQLSINLILTILRLALMLIEDSIQWADLLRWSCEGRLSSFRVNKFLPENSSTRHTDLFPAMRHHFITNEMRRVTGLLDIKDIPSPDLFVLLQRYVFELCLPSEFLELAQKIMAVFPPCMDYLNFDNRAFPDYECRTMAYIIFVFKLLFSLDDVTEVKQSEFANTLNRYADDTSFEEAPHLFSWTDWTRYIECRKAVLSKYDVSMNYLCESGTSTTNSAFLEFWKNTEPLNGDVVPNQKINKNLLNELEMAAKRMQKTDTDVVVNFPSSMTPFRTYTQYLLDNHSCLLSKRSRQILSSDFGARSIRYLLDSQWATTIADKLSLNVDPVFGAAVHMKQFTEPKRNVPRLSKRRVIPAHVLTPVRVEDDRTRVKEKKTVEKFHPEFKIFDSNSRKSKKLESSFEVNYPSSNYWLFHDKLGKTSNEKFNYYTKGNLSVSFLYLLRECSKIIRCDTQALYEELITIEFAYASLFGGDHDYCKEASFIIYPNEW